jgi:hypothetical protein
MKKDRKNKKEETLRKEYDMYCNFPQMNYPMFMPQMLPYIQQGNAGPDPFAAFKAGFDAAEETRKKKFEDEEKKKGGVWIPHRKAKQFNYLEVLGMVNVAALPIAIVQGSLILWGLHRIQEVFPAIFK